MRLGKKDAALLREVRHGNLTTNRWRRFVPISNKGLVDIDSEENIFAMRRITLTDKGRAALEELNR